MRWQLLCEFGIISYIDKKYRSFIENKFPLFVVIEITSNVCRIGLCKTNDKIMYLPIIEPINLHKDSNNT